MNADLAGTVTVVTGGGRGLGAAVARRFVAEGSKVVVLDLAVEEETPNVDWIEADVTAEDQLAQAVERILATHGTIDALVNCAGLIGPLAPVQLADPERWKRTIEVNLTGTFLSCRAVLPGMLERRSGRIINFASAAGVEYGPGRSAYCASKAAVISLTKTLAREVHETGVRVNAICPGPVDTPMMEEFLDRGAPELAESVQDDQIAMKELRDAGGVWLADQVLDLIVFLASAAGSRLSGQFIRMSSKTDPGVYH
jgi:NAD(P)-dependent dehydrogenase (short-subunit alcohol dehydrogenase family)